MDFRRCRRHLAYPETDFLAHHGLHVDLEHRCLHDSRTKLSSAGLLDSTVPISPVLATPAIDSLGTAVLRDFPELLPQANIALGSVKHSIQHVITTHGPPQFARPVVCHQPSSQLLALSLTFCSHRISSSRHLVLGLLLCTWFRRNPEIGAPVAIIAP